MPKSRRTPRRLGTLSSGRSSNPSDMSGLFGGPAGTGSSATGTGTGTGTGAGAGAAATAGDSGVPGGCGSNWDMFGSKKDSAGIPDVPKAAVGIFSGSPTTPPATTTTSTPLPTDVAALHSIINTLQAELKATTSVNNHLAASVARFQAEQATPTPAATATAPAPCFHPDHPRTIASGRGAASPEIFKYMIEINWHGSLGCVHMVDVDALPFAALVRLDSLVRRNLQVIFPRGVSYVYDEVDANSFFGSLLALGLRLEARARSESPWALPDHKICNESTAKRALHLAGYFYDTRTNYPIRHAHGLLLETLVELARYRGLFDDHGYVKGE